MANSTKSYSVDNGESLLRVPTGAEDMMGMKMLLMCTYVTLSFLRYYLFSPVLVLFSVSPSLSLRSFSFSYDQGVVLYAYFRTHGCSLRVIAFSRVVSDRGIKHSGGPVHLSRVSSDVGDRYPVVYYIRL